MASRFRQAAVVTALLALAACADTIVDPTLPAALRLDALPDTIGVGDTVAVVPRVIDGRGHVVDGRRITITSLTPEAVVVEASTGRLIALSPGEARIRAAGAGLTLERTVVVSRLVRDLTVTIPRDSVIVGDRFTVGAASFDGAGVRLDDPFRFSSTDTLVVRVDSLTGAARVVGDGDAHVVVTTGGTSRARAVRAFLRVVRPPVQFATFRDVAIGDGFICGVSSNATVFCEGDNSFGAIGQGGTSSSPWALTVVQGLTGIQRVVAAGRTVCATSIAGTVWCWGDGVPGRDGPTGTPTRVADPGGAIYATSGPNLGPGGVGCVSYYMEPGAWSPVRCWGRTTTGLLGGATEVATADTLPGTDSLSNGWEMGIGIGHACARGRPTVSPTPDSASVIFCWGAEMQNFTAVDTGTVLRPTRVPEALGDFTDIVVTRFGTCARDQRRRVLVCWGRDGGHGELPGAVRGPAPGVPGPYMPPTVVPGLTGVVAVRASTTTLCARLAAGDTWCRGRAARGVAVDEARTGGWTLLSRRRATAALAVGSDRTCAGAPRGPLSSDLEWWCPK